MIRLNNKWEFVYTWSDDFMKNFIDGETVRLPHHVGSLSMRYTSFESGKTVCGYRKILDIPKEIIGSRIFLQFDGAAHIAEIFLNSRLVAKHYGGYTSFRVDISNAVHAGKNQLTVKLDCTENPETPPFGGSMQELTYGGLYRDVWLDIRPDTYIENVYISTIDSQTIHVDVNCVGEPMLTDIEIFGPGGSLVTVAKNCRTSADIRIPGAKLWSVQHPNLYRCLVTIKGEFAIDTYETTFGIRTAEWKEDGFYLNGEKFFINGLNRMQSFPYIGYAAPEHLQREDARILKEEIGVNAVRTAHAPHSPYFIDACDKEGLLVFMEMPGAAYIGDEEWKQHALDSLREMILQFRNHPSVILWGVRINDSLDDDDFYAQTTALAHELDPHRATAGSRNLDKSRLLEDVYAYNDYSHNGTNIGCRPKPQVTPDTDKPYVISEANGYMFPTRAGDSWTHRQEQALRHARVLDGAMSSRDVAGCFQSTMCDFPANLHQGGGDGLCCYGVMDFFRNPKLAAYVYQSQTATEPFLEISASAYDGDYPAANKGSFYAFTNADEVRLYKNDAFVQTFSAADWDALPHGPIEIDDMIGELLQSQEGFDEKKASLLRKCLLAAQKYGFQGMPVTEKALWLYAVKKYKLSQDEISALLQKYTGSTNTDAVRWRLHAVRDGRVTKKVLCAPASSLHLEAIASRLTLMEGDSYDMALVRIRIVDENGNLAPYANLPVILATEGIIHVVGPQVVTAEGGMCGTLVCTEGWSGDGKLIVYTETGLETILDFVVTIPY